jgi:hypothetical protein
MGTSGNQFNNAPVAGELMATIVNGVESGHNHDAEPLSCNAATSGTVMG